MGDNLRQDDEPGIKPDQVIKRGATEGDPDSADAEGHLVKRGATDKPADEGSDAKDEGKPGADGAVRWSDVNRKQAIVPVRW